MADNGNSGADKSSLVREAARIATAYVGNNTVPQAELPDLIGSVYAALKAVSSGQSTEAPSPAVPVKKSVQKDYITCLEDGQKLMTLKRHLSVQHGMTPEEYRAKWGLQPSYPMVAPNYATRRSKLAKKIGLGQKPTAKRRGRRAK